MADKKISQLTGASTPLGGTEVLPIVQSGSTVKVSVANLTAGRAAGALSFTSTAVGGDIAQLLGTGLTITHAGGTTSFATFNQFPGWGATMTITSSATEFGINAGLPFALRDGNGLEVLKTSPQVSAVNEVTIANAATGNAPVVSATGNDTNIDLTISPKGTGSVNLAKVKIDAGTINGAMSVGGTWTAAATWTLPALTLGGTITSNGQTFSGTIANLGTVTTADINGGTIDGTTIGGSSKANGSFLTVIGSDIFTYRASDAVAVNDVWYVLGAVSSNQIWRLMITDSNSMATWHRADDLYIDKSSVATFKNIYDVNPGYATREWRVNAGNLEWRVTGAGGNTGNTVTAMRVA